MEKHSLNIGLVSFAWGPSDKGGLMTHVRGMAESLSKLGHNIFVHCVDTKGENNSFETNFIKLFEWSNVLSSNRCS